VAAGAAGWWGASSATVASAVGTLACRVTARVSRSRKALPGLSSPVSRSRSGVRGQGGGLPAQYAAQTGEFDMDNSADLTACLRRIIDDPNVSRVILDMRGTTFMDSSGIRAVMDAHHSAIQSDKLFEVANWTKTVRRVFEILELADALERDPDTPA
jgi:anti-anti-sigma factor